MLNFDRLPTKKSRYSGTPEVHVAVNIALPMTVTPTQQQSAVIHMLDTHQACSPVFPALPTARSFNPPVHLLLELMDIDEPSPNLKYIDLESELVEFGIPGVLDLYRLPKMVLATFGSLTLDEAGYLHAYMENWLRLLIQPEGGSVVPDGKQEGVAVEDVGHVAGAKKGKGRLVKEESKEIVIVWSSDEECVKDESKDLLPPIEVLGSKYKDNEDDAAVTDSSESSIEI
jgi:hypothetical protein